MKRSKLERRLEMVQRRIQANLDGLEKELNKIGEAREKDMDNLALCLWETQMEFRRQAFEDSQRWIGWVLDPESLDHCNELGET